MIRTFNNHLFKILDLVLTACVTFLVGMLFAQVVLRYVFNSSFASIDELGRFIFIWVTLISLSVAFRSKSHLGVTAITSRISAKKRFYVEKGISVANLFFMGILVVYGLKMSGVAMDQVSPTLGVPMGWIYGAIPFGALLCILTEVERLTEKYSAKEEFVCH